MCRFNSLKSCKETFSVPSFFSALLFQCPRFTISFSSEANTLFLQKAHGILLFPYYQQLKDSYSLKYNVLRTSISGCI